MSYTFSFYNSHSLEIKDLQPWTKCSHNSDDIQHMAILFSRRSDEWQIWGYTVTFQYRDFLYTPLLCWTHWINIFAMWVKYQFGSRWHAQPIMVMLAEYWGESVNDDIFCIYQRWSPAQLKYWQQKVFQVFVQSFRAFFPFPVLHLKLL